MRVTTLLKKLLGIQSLVVVGLLIEDGALVIDVRPSWRKGRCSGCGRRRGQYDRQKVRRWRHLDFGGVRVYLQYAPRRVWCPKCGVKAEKVPWCDSTSSRFTSAFEEAVGFLVQRCDKTSVTEMFGIAWVTVGLILERVMHRHRLKDPLDGLTAIAVDELSYRKGHKYVTTVANQSTGQIVWVGEGKASESLNAFFEELGQERCLALKFVSIDMSQAYISSIQDKLPHAQIIFDRFHVQRLVSDALDMTRREEWHRLQRLDKDEAEKVKGLRWPLLKNPWNLTPKQSDRLSTLQDNNSRLYRAYLLKESFADILDRLQPNVVKNKLTEWISWACHSRLPHFVKVARSIRRHIDDIVAYIRYRLTNGIIEGLHNKARVITHRSYGFHSASAFAAMIMLCCTGIHILPPYLRLSE